MTLSGTSNLAGAVTRMRGEIIDPVEVMKFNEGLAVGQTVRVRWTNCGYVYEGLGEIVKLNACSARVRLAAAVSSYPAGHEITQDILNFRTILRWSPSNTILPVPGEVAT